MQPVNTQPEVAYTALSNEAPYYETQQPHAQAIAILAGLATIGLLAAMCIVPLSSASILILMGTVGTSGITFNAISYLRHCNAMIKQDAETLRNRRITQEQLITTPKGGTR